MERSWKIDTNLKVIEKLKIIKNLGELKKEQNFKNFSVFQKDNLII